MQARAGRCVDTTLQYQFKLALPLSTGINARGRKTHEEMSTPTRGGAPPSRPQSASSARRPSSGKGFTDAARAAAAAARKEPAADRQTGRGSSEAVLRAGEPECRRSKLIGRRCAAGGGGVGD